MTMQSPKSQQGGDDFFLRVKASVVSTAAYRALSDSAKVLLLDIWCQYNGRNNGTLVAGKAIMKSLGWNSNDKLYRARDELERSGLLFVTNGGAKPGVGRKPKLIRTYALSFFPVDSPGLLVNAFDLEDHIERFPGLQPESGVKYRTLRGIRGDENDRVLAPSGGTKVRRYWGSNTDSLSVSKRENNDLIAPSDGTKRDSVALSSGTNGNSLAPSGGPHIAVLAPPDGTVAKTIGISKHRLAVRSIEICTSTEGEDLCRLPDDVSDQAFITGTNRGVR